MSHTNEGIVVELRGNYALVMPSKLLTCEENTCKNSEKAMVEMINISDAKLGDRVRYVSNEFNLLKAVFVVYMLPMILVAVGAAIGYYAAPQFNMDSVFLAVVMSVLFFAVSIVLIKLYDIYAAKSDHLKPIIIEVLGSLPEKQKAEIIDITARITKNVS